MNTEEEEEEKEGSLTGELGEGVWKGGGGKGRPIGRSCWSPPSSSFERGGRAEWRIGIRFVTLPFHFLLPPYCWQNLGPLAAMEKEEKEGNGRTDACSK